jgi:colanic acid biosynthesis glycosyl transferase WcaI
MVIRLARQLERAAYRAADRIVVLSRAFTANLLAKGVPDEKIELIYDPATRLPRGAVHLDVQRETLRILSMGNIGHSQGLTSLVRALEARPDVSAQLVITGTGVAAREARAEVRTDRIEMLGLVDDQRLESELCAAQIGFVSQRYDGSEFNIPSKLMNFMAYGLPILAAVNPNGEVARIVTESGAGWIVDSSQPDSFPREVARLAGARHEIAERSVAARRYAEQHFSQPAFAKHFERVLEDAACAEPKAPRRR